MSNFALPAHISKVTRDYTVNPLAAEDPAIGEAVQAYIAKWGLPPDSKPTSERWFGVFSGNELIVVVGERGAAGDILEISDCYTLPGKGRKTVMAIYSVINTYRLLMQLGLVNRIMCSVLFRNKTFARALERVFDTQPVALLYMATNA